MPSHNRIVICAAGGGKTTRIVEEALGENCRSAIVTYTRNNEAEILKKIYDHVRAKPSRIEVMTWYTFLLRELARPYRGALHNRRIETIAWCDGTSLNYTAATDIARHYFAGGTAIYEDKIAKFICQCNEVTNGAVLRRLSQRFDHIYIDEVQDMAGWDLELMELMMRAGIKLSLVGDHRQATLRTNNSPKNKAYAGAKIINKFREWEKAGLSELSYQQKTHRCHQHIAKLSDRFYPDEPPTKSLNVTITGHDGIFTVASAHVENYVMQFSPQVLRYSIKSLCDGLPAMNFGQSKGLTFDRVLIFPHGVALKWLKSGDLKHVVGSAASLYVGTTRARHSVAFVFDGISPIPGFQVFV